MFVGGQLFGWSYWGGYIFYWCVLRLFGYVGGKLCYLFLCVSCVRLSWRGYEDCLTRYGYFLVFGLIECLWMGCSFCLCGSVKCYEWFICCCPCCSGKLWCNSRMCWLYWLWWIVYIFFCYWRDWLAYDIDCEVGKFYWFGVIYWLW